MFRVMTKGFSQDYDRWTDALDQANSLVPKSKSLFNEVRIAGELKGVGTMRLQTKGAPDTRHGAL